MCNRNNLNTCIHCECCDVIRGENENLHGYIQHAKCKRSLVNCDDFIENISLQHEYLNNLTTIFFSHAKNTQKTCNKGESNYGMF